MTEAVADQLNRCLCCDPDKQGKGASPRRIFVRTATWVHSQMLVGSQRHSATVLQCNCCLACAGHQHGKPISEPGPVFCFGNEVLAADAGRLSRLGAMPNSLLGAGCSCLVSLLQQVRRVFSYGTPFFTTMGAMLAPLGEFVSNSVARVPCSTTLGRDSPMLREALSTQVMGV